MAKAAGRDAEQSPLLEAAEPRSWVRLRDKLARRGSPVYSKPGQRWMRGSLLLSMPEHCDGQTTLPIVVAICAGRTGAAPQNAIDLAHHIRSFDCATSPLLSGIFFSGT